MSFDSLLVSKIDVKRFTLAVDGNGDGSKSWATIFHKVPCRVNALGATDELIAWDSQKIFASYVFFLRVIAIVEGDRIYFGTRIFEVKKVDQYDEIGMYLRIAAVEVRP